MVSKDPLRGALKAPDADRILSAMVAIADSARDPCLVADIGGTHARFASTAGSEGPLSGRVELATRDYQDSSAMIRDAMAALNLDRISAACLATAGPVTDGRAEITNGGLDFSVAQLTGLLGAPVRLVNDFYALGAAVDRLGQLERVGGSERPPRRVRALLGPGSGLGMGLLVPDGQHWRILPSEGGHADLAPGNHLEQEVLGLLLETHHSVCWETVLSGPGLVNLYRAVAALWGAEPRDLEPEEVSRLGVEAADPVCHQTLEMFFGWLGAAAGNLALTVCALGGVYIGGGIVPPLRDFAVASSMRRRFEERCELEAFVKDIPLLLILDANPGLIGAQACLSELPVAEAGSGVDT